MFRLIYTPFILAILLFANIHSGFATTLSFSCGRATGTLDPEGNGVSWKYDGQDHVVEKTSAAGEVTISRFDANHNQTGVDFPRGGGTLSMAYDALGRIDLVTDQDDATTDYVYLPTNTKDRPDQIIDASGTTTLLYKTSGKAIGRLWKSTDADNLTVEYEYDANGQLDWIKAPGGFQTQFTYSSRGDLLDTTDPKGVKTSFLYNKRHQPIQTTADDGGTTQAIVNYTYDNQGNPASTTAPPDNGAQRVKSRAEYSPTNKIRFTRESDEDGEGPNDPTTEIRYDTRDWQHQMEDPLHRVTTFSPKPNGDLFQTLLPLGRTTEKELDGDGRLISATTPGSPTDRVSTVVYDSLSGYPRTISTTPDGLQVETRQDHSGRTRFVKNRKGKTWEFRYDGLGRSTHIITPLDALAGRSHRVEYHQRGAVKKVTEASGQITNFSYAASTGRLATVSDNVGSIAYTAYDDNGNLLDTSETRTGVTGAKTTNRTYDRQNRLLSRTDENGRIIDYRYYASGKPWKIIYPGGTETGTGHVEYTWWKSGRLKEVIDKLDSTTAPRITRYDWNVDGRLAKVTRHNGTVRENTYDAAGRPEVVTEYGPGKKLIFVHKHGYYPSDEVKWRYSLPAKQTSGTDPPAPQAMTFNDDNQLASWNGQTVEHDPDGNMVLGPAPDASTGSAFANYTYDARNRLTSALGTSYTYDADGQRVGLISAAGAEALTIDTASPLSKVLVREKNGVTTRYVWGLGLAYEVNGSGPTATTLCYHYDGSGSTLALTNDAAKVVERISYTPYGQIESRVSATGTPHDTPYLFTGFFGNQTDANGLLHMRARYYNPLLARFLNSDPARDGMNWYGYAGGNPINFVDPTGLGYDGAINSVQNTLSFLGMTPGLGVPIDLVNAGISIGRGNYIEAGLSLAAALPVIGDIAGGARIAGGGVRAVGGGARGGGGLIDDAARAWCFVAGTKVKTPDGDKVIEQLIVGDRVMTHDPETGEEKVQVVLQTFHSWTDEVYDISIGNEVLSTTGSHRFWLPDEKLWVAAKHLKVGQVLLGQKQTRIIIDGITTRSILCDVYNLEVESDHNYFAGHSGVLVHNGDVIPFDDFNQARNGALQWLEGRGFKADAQVMGKFGATQGRPIGMSTADGRVGFRIEFDSRSGAHINVWDHNAPKEVRPPHFTFNASEKTVMNIHKQFFCK